MKYEEEYLLRNMKKITNFEAEVSFICTYFDFDIFVDAGPNAPFTEAWLVRQKKPGCHIIGFEPHPSAFKKLCTYFYPGTLSSCAISSNPGVIRGVCTQDHASNFAKVNDEVVAATVGVTMDDLSEVKTVTIDQILQHTPSSSNTFIWADVQGSELDIILGAHESLEANKICGFMLELDTTARDGCGCYWKEVAQVLGGYGFSPAGLFNLQPTHFDCMFVKIDGKPVWSENELGDVLERMMRQYIDDPSQVPTHYTFEHIHAGMSFL